MRDTDLFFVRLRLSITGVALAAALAPANAPAAPARPIEISLGASQRIGLPALHKAIIEDPTRVGLTIADGDIILRGLQPGETKLEIRDLTDRLVKAHTIKVTENRPERPTSKLPEFCNKGGIACSSDANHIAGEADGHTARDQALLYCRHHPYCIAAVRLTSRALSDQTEHYRALFPEALEITSTESHQPVVRFDCAGKSLRQWREQANTITAKKVDRGLLIVECANTPPQNNNYRITTIVTLKTNETEATRSQLWPGSAHRPMPSHITIDSGKISRSDQNVIAKPVITAPLGREVGVQAGSETPYTELGSSGSTITSWKQLGVECRFTLSMIDNTGLTLSYAITLKQGHTLRRIASSSIQGWAGVQISSPLQLGEVAIDAASVAMDGSFWFEHIPIIGPLFARKQTQAKEATIVYTVQIEKLSPEGPPV